MKLLTNLFRWLRVLGDVLLNHGSLITWDRTVGASGGGIQLSVDGMTTLNDAGAAGAILQYDSATGIFYTGRSAAGSNYYYAVYPGGNQLILRSDNSFMTMYGPNGPINFSINGGSTATPTEQISMGGNGWLLSKGVQGEVDPDFVTPVAAVIDWVSTLAGGSALTALAGRGGIYRWLQAAAGNCYSIGLQVFSSQDAYRAYIRARNNTVAEKVLFGFGNDQVLSVDGVAFVHDDTLAAPTHWYTRSVRAGVVADLDTGVVDDQAFHIFEIVTTTAGVVTMYIDGALVRTVAAANAPLTTVLLRKVVNCYDTVASLDMDVFKTVESRNTAGTA